MSAHLVRQSLNMLQPRRVFFRRDDTFWRRHTGKGLVDTADVFLVERMMVAEGQRHQLCYQWRKVVNHLFRRGNTRQQQYILSRQVRQRSGFAEQGLWRSIVYCREKELLIGIEVHRLGNDAILHRLQVFRTFGHYDDVGTVFTVEGFTQPASRQQLVVDDKAVIVYQQDVDARLDVAMLEGIVQQNDIQPFVKCCQLVYSVTAILVDCHLHIWILLLHLIRLVADIEHRRVSPSQYKAFALSLVAATQHGNTELVLECLYQIFDMGCLARTSYRDVTYRNDRNIKGTALQYTDVEHRVPKVDAYAIEPAQRQQRFIYLDEIAFQNFML